MTRHEPADSFETPRFSDVRTFMRLPNDRDPENHQPEEQGFVRGLVGLNVVGCDVVEVCPHYVGPGKSRLSWPRAWCTSSSASSRT